MTSPAPRGPLAVVRIYHDEIFSLVSDEAATPVQGQVTVGGETFQSLGEYRVNSIKGDAEEIRHKVQMTVPGGYTEVEVSPDVVGTPTEFTHMAEFLLDRHAPGEHVTGLFCRSGDEKVAQRLAAVMGVEYLTTEPTAQAPAPEPAVDTTVAAPVPAPEG